ncbi:hypothetical protein UFOVP55_66 [uncultured Caudovirales phage]|uniref:Uncharacterized protein n=1 Tax=uncultured Caudovirales phage TaxID=2100421 RepID=A0A6J5KVY4_9CAUD|nr:hypothetical protein UFOVP55_66 [uncultured Caudovirales phage]
MKAPRVKQVRGKGMNAGGTNPRQAAPDPVAEKSDTVEQGSYLPAQQFAGGGKVRAMSYGKGSKVISSICGMKRG